MRLFLGIELSDDQKQAIASSLSGLQNSTKGWEHPHDYHLTLLFIGQFPEEKLSELLARLSTIESSPFVLTTSGFHFFNRRIMYLGVEHSPELYQLRNKILEIFPEFDPGDEKKFIPHITVKRWQRYEYADLLDGISRFTGMRIRINVRKLSLFLSEKDLKNRKYHVIHRLSLHELPYYIGVSDLASKTSL